MEGGSQVRAVTQWRCPPEPTTTLVSVPTAPDLSTRRLAAMRDRVGADCVSSFSPLSVWESFITRR